MMYQIIIENEEDEKLDVLLCDPDEGATKRMRNKWTCARPVTQIVPNERAYSRKRNKDIINKRKVEDDE